MQNIVHNSYVGAILPMKPCKTSGVTTQPLTHVMSSVVETSQWRFLHSLRLVEMTVSVNIYVITNYFYVFPGFHKLLILHPLLGDCFLCF